MPDPLGWVVATAVGGVIGALYLGGLWLTVRRVPTSRHRVLLTLGSFLIRLALAGLGLALLLVDDRDPVRLLAALAGFVAVRTVLVWRVRRVLPEPSGVQPWASRPTPWSCGSGGSSD